MKVINKERLREELEARIDRAKRAQNKTQTLSEKMYALGRRDAYAIVIGLLHSFEEEV